MTNDPNFVTFVLFVVTNCLTTKDAKHTKEETQRTPRDDSKAHSVQINAFSTGLIAANGTLSFCSLSEADS